jgi:hypothetical protein
MLNHLKKRFKGYYHIVGCTAFNKNDTSIQIGLIPPCLDINGLQPPAIHQPLKRFLGILNDEPDIFGGDFFYRKPSAAEIRIEKPFAPLYPQAEIAI